MRLSWNMMLLGAWQALENHCNRPHRARRSLMGDELTALIGRTSQRRAVLPPPYTADQEVGGGRRHAPPTLAQIGWAASPLSLMFAGTRTSLDGRLLFTPQGAIKISIYEEQSVALAGDVSGFIVSTGFENLVIKQYGHSPKKWHNQKLLPDPTILVTLAFRWTDRRSAYLLSSDAGRVDCSQCATPSLRLFPGWRHSSWALRLGRAIFPASASGLVTRPIHDSSIPIIIGRR